MKKKRIIFTLSILFLMIFLTSCTKSNNNIEEDNEYVTLSFDSLGGSNVDSIAIKKGTILESLYYYSEYEGYEFLGWSLESLSTDKIIFPFVITEDTTVYAIWGKHVEDYSYLLDEYIPSVISTSLTLPTQNGEYQYIWYTSNEEILSNYGELSQTRYEEHLTVYLDVYLRGEITSYSKDVTITPLSLPTLEEGHTVFGYYSSWNYFGYTDIMNETVDVINLSFAYVNADYTLNMSSLISIIPRVIKAHEQGIRVVLSVQGYSSGGINFSSAAKTDEGRKKLAQSMLEIIEKYHFDGIDIDWEYPGYGTGTQTSIDRANYTLLIKQINETLKTACSDYIVSAAIPGGPYLTSRFDLTNVSKYLDYIHIMTYDLQSSSSATHHTALYDSNGTISGCSVDASVKTYLSAGVDPKKIIIGIAFYGKYTTATSLSSSAKNGYSSIVYTKIKNNYLSRIGKDVVYMYDEVACAPYLLDTTNNYFITYDDERSIAAKCNYALTNALGGVMIWELGEDTTDTLLNQIKISMKK